MAQRITFLKSSNFQLMGPQHKLLGINLQGAVLVFFKMSSCETCAAFEPVFVELSRVDRRISYGVIDVEKYTDVTVWSRNSNTPINGVPVLILYLNGTPKAKFTGNKNIASLRNFITNALAPPSGEPEEFQQPRQAGRGGPPRAGGSPPSRGPPPPGGRGSNMYSDPDGDYEGNWNQQRKPFMPEIGRAPSLKGVLKNGPPAGYSVNGSVEDDDEPLLIRPDTITPWNTPWEAAEQQNY